MKDLPEWCNSRDVADFYGISVNTVRLWRETDRGPKFIVRGYSRYYYRREDVIDFGVEHNYVQLK